MALGVNLDALVPREDFEVLRSAEDEALTSQTIQVRDLERAAFFYGALRKPDFQRETSEWDTRRVARLLSTFMEGDLIPAVILWKNRDLLFVIDGSHRLSALIAWVQDDYGDGPLSQRFFGHDIHDEQIKAAQRTREQINKAIGSYEDHKRAMEDPDAYGPDIVARARRLGSLALQLQWVRGDSEKAEDSFIRINQQAAIITPQEMELIKSRREPSTIAARAIIRRGTGHKYWSSFDPKIQEKIESLASDVNTLLFEPAFSYPLKTADLPAGGPVYSSTALRMVYDFINLSVGGPESGDDPDGIRTVEYLERAQRVLRLICSNHPSSLGLHPAVYFYSWTGKQQPILFLAISELVIELKQRKQLKEFAAVREKLETFLVENRALVNQVVRKFGTKSSGRKNLLQFYKSVLALLYQGESVETVVFELLKQDAYSYLQPEEVPYARPGTSKVSTQVKSGVVLDQLLQTVVRCPICGGAVPAQGISIDHKTRRRDGGSGAADNAQVTHPFCNTGIKN